MPLTPFVWGVLVKKSDGSARSGVNVRITNVRTGNFLDSITNNNGQAVFDLANFEDGYDITDIIRTEKLVSDNDMEYFITSNGDETFPTLIECVNGERIKLYSSTARIKLNLTRNPGGKGPVLITLN